MAETITQLDVEASIELSSKLPDPITKFKITLNRKASGTIVKSVLTDRGGSTKVPGGPGLMPDTGGYIFELRTEPRVISTRVEELDEQGNVKVTIKILILAKKYEETTYDDWAKERFRVIHFDEVPRDIAVGRDYQMIASPLENDDVVIDLIYNTNIN